MISAPVIQAHISGGSGIITGNFSVEESTNLAVLLGAWVFIALLAIAIVNQWHTLSVLQTEIGRQQQRLADDYELVSGQFADQFEDLTGRIWWHRVALGGVAGAAALGALLATIAFLMLTARGSTACLAFWR